MSFRYSLSDFLSKILVRKEEGGVEPEVRERVDEQVLRSRSDPRAALG